MSHNKEKGNSKLQMIVKLAVSSILMVWLFTMIDWQEALHVMQEGSPFYLLIAFIAIQITVITSIWKWKLLVDSAEKPQVPSDVSIGKLGKLYYIGLFFNNFLPGSVGGDVMRIFYLGKMIRTSSATASVLFERITSGAALVGIVLLSALFLDHTRSYLISVVMLILIVSVVFFLFFYWSKKELTSNATTPSGRKWYHLLYKGKKAIKSIGGKFGNYRNEGWVWWSKVALLSLLFQVGMAWINDLLFLSFGIEIPFLHLLVIITLISVITMLPISLNGLGVREAGYVLFFQSLGVPGGIALSVSLLFFFLVTISSLIGGIFWLAERRKTYHEVIRQ
ncbi:lysylphosphatidylglycerol synthase transmembrane domain-containing protein [Bacillus sp. B15-48]|uniref:lysylphosphatidylglycerol synthase transmembrane domain-containing protein n=1 Tax=Bacillus sp. B15-48 TaxID=1548601 RepID=UPI00193F905A|nr:lysylphosphatidylglycerol synthase transmembrane domain-containing protein [Bacillus sp. B15-48]MBM4762970.1 flippase-like domain-containing protein [Bacillus sp. B15-48]